MPWTCWHDALVYAVSLYAAGLGLLVLADILRRFLADSEPVSARMMGMGLLALLANITCLLLIAKHRAGEVHMRASWIFSRNDVIANLGVILAGGLVAWTGSRYPDLVIGLLVVRGGVHILRDARATLLNGETSPPDCPSKTR